MDNRSKPRRAKTNGIFARIDLPLLVCYILLIIIGWIAVCGASYGFDVAALFSLSSRPVMQLIWWGMSVVLILFILLIDKDFFPTFAPIIYIAFILLLLVTLGVARDIKGSRSWLEIGRFSLQPAEFTKVATALMLAYMGSTYKFRFDSLKGYAEVFAIVLLPMIIIILQKETGSALVYTAFFVALYREGFSGYFLSIAFLMIFLFVAVLSLNGVMWGATRADVWLVASVTLLAALRMLFLLQKRHRKDFIRLLYVIPAAYLLTLVLSFLMPFDWSYTALFLLVLFIGYLLFLAIRYASQRYLWTALFAGAVLLYSLSVGQVYNHVLQPHQQQRIAVALGLKQDIRGAGYNVNQAKIAIGSGGLTGKGFLKGTQTKLNYVPEQDTDFIFCTIAEEWGFLGASFLLLVYFALIVRLVYVAERQPTAFARIYGYCVAAVILFHVAINVGMVTGLVPVIGIPLPFISYGGSSLWSFTIMLFIFLRLDSVGKSR